MAMSYTMNMGYLSFEPMSDSPPSSFQPSSLLFRPSTFLPFKCDKLAAVTGTGKPTGMHVDSVADLISQKEVLRNEVLQLHRRNELLESQKQQLVGELVDMHVSQIEASERANKDVIPLNNVFLDVKNYKKVVQNLQDELTHAQTTSVELNSTVSDLQRKVLNLAEEKELLAAQLDNMQAVSKKQAAENEALKVANSRLRHKNRELTRRYRSHDESPELDVVQVAPDDWEVCDYPESHQQ